ncbi:phage portal protein [Andreesenia angusta]|uniref:Phage portal protein n=1 Tax=Andreesenia angusta TaxID=39480 RepID=A0A1S1V8J7_9FIRM|nr:phage portal protein [Andreesenia angusta]OHW62916.1 phage portal protein [Andreesenia angusta]
MGIFKRLGTLVGRDKTETRMTLEELVLKFGGTGSDITKSQAMNIPSVASCVELIANTVATLPITLYTDTGDSVHSTEDHRVALLNDETGDMLDGFQFKKAIVEDYLLNGNGYAYINRSRNKVKSIHRVDSDYISVNESPDPIFKDYDIFVNGIRYRDFEFVKVTRKTKNGVTGKGVIEENNMILSVAYNALVFENVLVKTGGNKKGFLKSQSRLEQKAMDQLKAAWKNLYGNNEDNVMVLNQGLDFQEASNTSVEMQLNENKKTNSAEICKLFNVPVALLEGKATEQEYNNFIKTAILPILKAIETALNKDLLLPSEKKSFYFAFDTKDLLKGDMEKRYKAYELAVKNGIMQIDEVRYREDLAPLNLDFIKLGLQDVLYNPKTKEIYTPNTNKTNSIEKSDGKGGEEDANRGEKQSSNS